MKWIGAIIFIGMTTLGGFEWSNKLNRRPKNIRQLKNALQILEAEIVYSQLSLRDAFEQIAKQTPKPTRIFFQLLGEKMAENNDFMEVWDASVDIYIRDAALTENIREILSQFGRTLGQHDFRQQQKHILLAITHLDREFEEARDAHFKYSKMAKGLGLLIGLFIVILLI